MFVFRKIWCALFSCNTRLRFSFLPYYRRNANIMCISKCITTFLRYEIKYLCIEKHFCYALHFRNTQVPIFSPMFPFNSPLQLCRLEENYLAQNFKVAAIK